MSVACPAMDRSPVAPKAADAEAFSGRAAVIDPATPADVETVPVSGLAVVVSPATCAAAEAEEFSPAARVTVEPCAPDAAAAMPVIDLLAATDAVESFAAEATAETGRCVPRAAVGTLEALAAPVSPAARVTAPVAPLDAAAVAVSVLATAAEPVTSTAAVALAAIGRAVDAAPVAPADADAVALRGRATSAEPVAPAEAEPMPSRVTDPPAVVPFTSMAIIVYFCPVGALSPTVLDPAVPASLYKAA